MFFFFFSSRRRHTRWTGDWSSDVCSSDLSSTFSSACHPMRRRPSRRNSGNRPKGCWGDRKSTRLNSSHPSTSYAVFCLKKKKNHQLPRGEAHIERRNEI